MVETTDVPDHQVVDELQRGYKLKDRLLRPAMVKVAQNSKHRRRSRPSRRRKVILTSNVKRDYYEVLESSGVAPSREIKSAYRKLPVAVPSGSESEQSGCGRQVQGSRGSLRGVDRRREAFRLRPLRTCRRVEFRKPADLIRVRSRISATSSGSSSASAIYSEQLAADDAPARNAAPTCGEDLTLEFEDAVFGTETKVNVRRHEACEECSGSGAAPGKAPVTCRSCQGRGQVRYQQGFFSMARTCPTCQGVGSVITDPCLKCKGEGRVLRQRTVEAKVPAGVEDGTRIRFTGYGEAGMFGGPAGDLYVVLHVKEHAFLRAKETTCIASFRFHLRRRPSGRDQGADTRGRADIESS